MLTRWLDKCRVLLATQKPEISTNCDFEKAV
jgi:hypothetical protein